MAKLFNFWTFVIVFFLSAVYVLIFSESGLLERLSLQKKKAGLEQRLQDLKSGNDELAARYEFYKNGGLTREDLLKGGYVRSGEKLVFLQGVDGEAKGELKREATAAPETVPLQHMRVIWIAVSAIVLLFYFLKSADGIKGER